VAAEPLLVDRAVGSHELADPLTARGLPVELTTLPSGDLSFIGNGADGAPLLIGIELKRLSDWIGSLQTKRFQGHQLLGMVRDFDRRYVIIEGDYTYNARGQMLNGHRVIKGVSSALALEKETLNMQTRGGLWIRHTTTRANTLLVIQAIYRYWTDVDRLEDHKSHLALYAPDLDKALLAPPTDFRKALAAILPGVSYVVSAAVEQHCGGSKRSLTERLTRMLLMDEADWANLAIVDGKGKARRFGEARARTIIETLQKGG
jgi:ERCC4-type nuclease